MMENLIICNIEECLFRDVCYCTHDLHECTPNDKKCKHYTKVKKTLALNKWTKK